MVLLIQSVNLVGCLDYFGGDQTWLTAAKAIHAIREAVVGVIGPYVGILVTPVWGGTAGAVPGDQRRVLVHVVGALPLR